MRHANLENALASILSQYPEGKSEYELFGLLQQAPFALFDKNCLSEPLLLFQSHFVLFHSLYQLRSLYLKEQIADIEIHSTLIKLQPYQSQKEGLTELDSLQAYYLDWRNFSTTSGHDVEQLLTQFWTAMGKGSVSIALDEVKAAFQYFELDVDSDLRQVKTVYRKYQHLHHPDKGGETQKAQQTEANFNLLKTYLSQP
ncbi:MAG: molecular chaperone DnaJ [Paraglaciecola sp.]|nr:molecular chaperone DnaJ [Paraglaciecola sp.]